MNVKGHRRRIITRTDRHAMPCNTFLLAVLRSFTCKSFVQYTLHYRIVCVNGAL